MDNSNQEFSGKRVLIMGANPETISLVVKAREMGCYTIVTDYNHDAKAKRFADKALDVDASDVDALVKVAKEERVDGVLLGVAEAISIPYCRVCERLGLPCFATEKLFNILTDKKSFKDLCRKYNVPTVPEYTISGSDCYDGVVYPVVVKPVDGCSSKGISICRNDMELKCGIDKALSFSRQKKIIVEKYMTDGEVVIYYAFQDGKPVFLSMCDRYTNKDQHGVAQLPTAYIFPSRYEATYLKNTDASVKSMFRGVGIENGVLFIQSFVDKAGNVYFYEPGYRLNGAQEHMILSKVIGIDAKEMLIRYALTGRMHDDDIESVRKPFSAAACKLSPLVMEGVIGKIKGIDEIQRMQDVVAVQPSYDEGDVVIGKGTLRQILTRIYLVCKNYKELFDSLDSVYLKLGARNMAGENILLKMTDINALRDIYGV